MNVLFYDRKNKQQVNSNELLRINFVETYATVDADDTFIVTGRRFLPLQLESITHEQYLEMEKTKDYENSFQCKLPTWDSLKKEKTPMVIYHHERVISNVGYKSKKCPKHQNWDLHCHESDLIFLSLIE